VFLAEWLSGSLLVVLEEEEEGHHAASRRPSEGDESKQQPAMPRSPIACVPIAITGSALTVKLRTAESQLMTIKDE